MKRLREYLFIAVGIAGLLLVYGLVEPSKPSDFSEKIMDQSREKALVKPQQPSEWDALRKWGNQFTPPPRVRT